MMDPFAVFVGTYVITWGVLWTIDEVKNHLRWARIDKEIAKNERQRRLEEEDKERMKPILAEQTRQDAKRKVNEPTSILYSQYLDTLKKEGISR